MGAGPQLPIATFVSAQLRDEKRSLMACFFRNFDNKMLQNVICLYDVEGREPHHVLGGKGGCKDTRTSLAGLTFR